MICLNDLEIKKLLLVVVATQVAILLLLAIDPPNLPPLMSLSKCVLGVFYVAVIPGTLLLHVLKLHHLGGPRTLIYTLALSLAFDIMLGLTANTLYPPMGIARPLSAVPIAATYAVAMSVLSVAAYLRDRSFPLAPRTHFPLGLASSFSLLFLLLLPSVAALGAQLVNLNDDNTLLLAFLGILSLLPLLVVWSKFIPEDLYPLAIVATSVSLLLHTSLISDHLWGWDIQREYDSFRVTEMQSLWTPDFPADTYNATVSVTILPVLFSRFTGLGGIAIFKVVLPALFALVPLAMYEILQVQTGKKVAFLATFFFVSQIAFFVGMPQMAKQEVAWLFFAAAVLALVAEQNVAERALATIFLLAMVASHYAVAYVALLLLAIAVAILLWRRPPRQTLTPNMSLLVLVATFSWYAYIAESTVFNSLVEMGRGVADGLRSGFLDPGSRVALDYVQRGELSPTRWLLKYFYVGSQFLIGLGFVVCFLRWIRRKRTAFSAEFVALSAAGVGLLAATAAVPQLSSYADINRSFPLTLFFLGPFFIYGVQVAFNLGLKNLQGLATGGASLRSLRDSLLDRPQGDRSPDHGVLTITALFLAAFLLLNSGVVSELSGEEHPMSFALARARMPFPVFSDTELAGAEWMLREQEDGRTAYHDMAASVIFQRLVAAGRQPQTEVLHASADQPAALATVMSPASYVYLSRANITSGQLGAALLVSPTLEVLSPIPLPDTLDPRGSARASNVIYDNGASLVLFTR